jgi:hypothetical protein
MTTIAEKKKREGEFYTPQIWVDEAHRTIEANLGKDWKNTFAVWDCASGHMNLTDGYKFKELYSSTLHQSDIDESKIQPGQKAFQFDFLNEDSEKLTDKCPELKQAIRDNKPLLFLINPPYATANNKGATSSHKSGTAKTWINNQMREGGWGKSSQQLYAQFLYRINAIKEAYHLSNVVIAVFSPPLFLTGASFKTFRERMFNNFRVQDGFLFPASEFMEVNSDWGISFTLMTPGQDDRTSWSYEIVRDPGVKSILPERKELYNTDKREASSLWVREDTKGMRSNNNLPQFTSAMKWKTEGKTMRGSMVEGAIGYFLNASNNIYENSQQVAMYSWAASKGNGFSIIPENLEKVCALFAARKTHTGTHATWINQKDEYLAPNQDTDLWKNYVANSLVYSLFHSASHQSSIGGIVFKGEEHDVRNEMFWGDPLLLDIKDSEGRSPTLMHGLLQKNLVHMSKLAKDVLNKANELLYWTVPGRAEYAALNRDLHMDRWDAGYAQLKTYWKQENPKSFQDLMLAYKELESELRWMTYEVGFLIK